MDWHVIYSGINCEFTAMRGLQAAGFECYIPIGKRIVRHARQEQLKTFPVFRRYIFVKFNSKDGWSPILSTDGVIDILKNNWEPVRVSPWIIEEIKIRENSGHFDIMPATPIKRPRWSKGMEILKKLLNVEAIA